VAYDLGIGIYHLSAYLGESLQKVVLSSAEYYFGYNGNWGNGRMLRLDGGGLYDERLHGVGGSAGAIAGSGTVRPGTKFHACAKPYIC
jgi:hypothetical protein